MKNPQKTQKLQKPLKLSKGLKTPTSANPAQGVHLYPLVYCIQYIYI